MTERHWGTDKDRDRDGDTHTEAVRQRGRKKKTYRDRDGDIVSESHLGRRRELGGRERGSREEKVSNDDFGHFQSCSLAMKEKDTSLSLKSKGNRPTWRFIVWYLARSATHPTSQNYPLVTEAVHSKAISAPPGSIKPAAITALEIIQTHRSLHCLISYLLTPGSRECMCGYRPCLGAQRHSNFSPPGDRTFDLSLGSRARYHWATIPILFNTTLDTPPPQSLKQAYSIVA